jgi:hypothetical protein
MKILTKFRPQNILEVVVEAEGTQLITGVYTAKQASVMIANLRVVLYDLEYYRATHNKGYVAMPILNRCTMELKPNE